MKLTNLMMPVNGPMIRPKSQKTKKNEKFSKKSDKRGKVDSNMGKKLNKKSQKIRGKLKNYVYKIFGSW